MAYVNAGLPNSGKTQHFEITYESTLPTAQGLDVALELMRFCDEDYRLLVNWFRGATNMPGRLPVHVDNFTIGATWSLFTTDINLGLEVQVLNMSPATFARYLLISEVSELFMQKLQPDNWFSTFNEGNKGEALSCFLANEFLSHIGLSSVPIVSSGGYYKAYLWLDSDRANFLDRNDANKAFSLEVSCGISFLNYLCHQRNIPIGDIIVNGSDTLEGVFENLGLGSRSDAFPTFKAAVDSHYVQDNRLSSLNPVLDNAFPVPELAGIIATQHVSWVKIGPEPRGWIALSRRAPMGLLLKLSTDRPDLIDLPTDLIVLQGMDGDTFSISVKPQSPTFANADATITVEYAGTKLQCLIHVYTPSALPMPPLRIVPQAPTDPCVDAFVEGSKQSFFIGGLSAFPSSAGLHIRWQVTNSTGTEKQDGTFVIDALPAAGTTVELTVIATNNDGVTARGSLDFTVQSKKYGLAHELAYMECRIRHIVDTANRISRLPIPEDKARRDEVLTNIVIHAKELSALANALAKDASSVAAKKGRKSL